MNPNKHKQDLSNYQRTTYTIALVYHDTEAERVAEDEDGEEHCQKYSHPRSMLKRGIKEYAFPTNSVRLIAQSLQAKDQ